MTEKKIKEYKKIRKGSQMHYKPLSNSFGFTNFGTSTFGGGEFDWLIE